MKKIYAILFLLCMLSCAAMAGNRCNHQVSASSPGVNEPTLPIIPGSRDSIILPFFEDWTAGSFVTHNWSFDPDQSNWSIATPTGNPAPSAQFGWSPQLANYNFALVSDTIDATAIMDNVTLKFDINLNNFSTSTLEGLAVEIFDGTTWQMVHDYTNANGSFDWISESYNITQWVAGHTFKVRFRAYGADSYNINYWYVDNIKIYQQVTGNFTGTVTRLLDGSPVAGAAITMTNALSGSYTATTIANGTYAFNGIEAGIYALTLEKEGYNVISEEDTILGNQTVTKDYQLTAPTIAVVPDSLSVTVIFGQTTTRNLTMTNSGNGPLAWSGSLQSNKKQVSIPASDGNFEHTPATLGVAPATKNTNVITGGTNKGAKGSVAYGFDVNNGIFMSFDMDDPSNPTTIANVSITPFGGTFDASHTDFMYVIDYNDGAIKKVEVATGNVTIVGYAGLVSGDTPTGLTCDKASGIFYASSTNGTESLLYTIDPATGASTVIGPTGIPALIDIAIDRTGQMYGYDIVGDNAYKIDKATGASTMIGSIGFDASYAQGMCWDPVSDAIYMAAYNASTGAGELRSFDKVTGNTAVLGSLPGEIDGFAFPGGMPNWASISPASGVIAAGGTQTVTVTFDGNYIPPQKDPLAGNLIFHSDPNVGQATVALSMFINGPWGGKLNGVVSHGTTPIEGVTVTATREESPVYVYSMVTGADGAYSFDPVIYGTYDITAEKEGFNPYSDTNVIITMGQTTVRNIAMVAPTMVIDPLSITEYLLFGQTITRIIHVTNNGDGVLGWTADVQTNIKKQASIPASDGNFEHTPASAGVAPVVNKTNVTSAYKGAKGSVAYGFDVNNGIFMSFDMDDPSNPTTIANVTITPFGGTFDGIHTDFMYIIDYNDGNIKTVDIATGNVTTVGPAGLQSGDTPTGLTCNKTDGTLYASSTNGAGSLLYSIDPATGAATVIGATGIPALIDIAIDGDGQMYGYDIVGDNAYMIDKTSGTSTLIGSIGFNASYAQGMCWDPESDAIYMAAYNASTGAGELRLFDKLTGSTAVLGSLPGEIDGFAFPSGCCSQWLTVNPRHGTVPPGATRDVTVTLDGNYIPPQKDYDNGTITFTSNPNVGTVIVPVTLIPNEDYGTLTGTVTHNGIPVPGVTLNATHNGMSYVTTSGNNGVYTFEELAPSTYSVTAEATGYNLFSTTGVIIGYGQTTTLPINLTAPTMDINPLSIEVEWPQLGQTITRTLTITNNGDGPLLWNGETETGFKKLSPKGSTGYAFSLGPEKYFFSFDTDNPSSNNIISTETISPAGGTFDERHTGFMYIIDANDSHLKKVNAATGNVTDIGLCSSTVGGQQSWTGIQVDKLQGGMYGVTTDNNESYLYIIDPSTGGASVIGPTGISNCADFAIDGGGQMYGIDIVGDNAYTIDMSTGASTLLGPLGFNAGNVMGMSWDSETDNVYFTSYNNTTSKSELYILDKVSGNATMVGPLLDNEVDGLAFPGNLYTWLTIDPKFGTVPPGDSVVVTASINGSWFPPQKDYNNGTITFTSDPNVGTVVVPVTILPPPPHYYLAGTVTHSGQPVAGITVTATKDSYSQSATTGADGTYWLSLAVSGTYVITTEAIGYNSYYGTCEVYGEYTPYDIYLTAPTMNISPDSLAISLNPNESGTLSLTLSNSGDGTLEYNVHVVSDSLWNYYMVPMSGLLGPGESSDLIFPVYANVPPGTYHAFIIFTSNVGTDSIPVTLTVLAGAYPTFTIQTVTNVEAGPVSVPVHANYISNLGSFQFTIEYDPALLTYTGTSNWYPGIDAVTVGEPIPGHLTFVWAAETQGINIPDGNFFTLDFTWNGQAGQTSALTWSDTPTPREFGDYNGNIFVPLYVNGQVSGNNIFNSTVSIENITVPNGSGMQTIAVPVHAQFAINPDCFQFTIEYDQWLSFQGVTNWNPSIVDSVMVEEPTPGHITFQWCAETQGLNITDGHFFDLLFQWPIGVDFWMTFPIIWSDDPMTRIFSWDYGTPIPVNYINGSASGDVIGGINKTAKESVKIYPNPASDYLSIEFSNDICKINVINNLGITVYEQNVTGGKTITINTSGYRAGNYIVQLITKDGQTINRKMMKQ